MQIEKNTFNNDKYLSEKEAREEYAKNEIAAQIIQEIKRRKDGCATYSVTDGSCYRNTRFTLSNGKEYSPNEHMMMEIAKAFVTAGYFCYDLDASNRHGYWRKFLFSNRSIDTSYFGARIEQII